MNSIELVKNEIESYLNKEIEPIYEKFARTKNSKDIKDLDEKLEVLQTKLDKLYAIDEAEAEHFYMTKVGTLPLKDTMLAD